MLKTNTINFRISVIGMPKHKIKYNEPVNISEEYYNCLVETLYL